MTTFKDMLKHLRMREGYSQAELADKLNISKSAISMYEVGKREPDFETLEKIADLFNVDMNFLLGKNTSENDAFNYYLDPEIQELADFMYKNPEYKVLFDASKNVKKEDIEFVREFMDRMRGEFDDTGC